MEAQNAVKKELTARFPREYFSWIHNILLKDEDEEEDVNNPENLYVTENNVIHRMSKGFGNLQTKWNLYVDLRKDGNRSSKGEEEALAFLQKMAMMRKMDINVAIRNVVLAWQNRFQAKKAKVLRLSTRLATRAILPPPLK